jgi:excisionase family DNA binding protein
MRGVILRAPFGSFYSRQIGGDQMRYEGDVIERLDRIEYLLAAVIARLGVSQESVSQSLVRDDRVLLKVREAAKQLGVSNSHLYQMIATKSFPSVKIGSSVRIPVEEMMNWIRKLDHSVRD